MHPDWRPTAAVALAATGAVLLAVTLLPGHAVRAPRPARRPRRDASRCSRCCRCWCWPPASSRRSGAERDDGHQEGPRRGLLVQPPAPGHGVRLRRSGRPRGRAVAARPHRWSAGLALAVLLVAGRRRRRRCSPRATPRTGTSPAWSSPRRPARPTSSSRTSDHPILSPVINITSAQLILGADTGTGSSTPSRGSSRRRPSTPRPSATTSASSVRRRACPAPRCWSRTAGPRAPATGRACRSPSRRRPRCGRCPDDGFVVESGGVHYLIAEGVDEGGTSLGAHRYALPQTSPRGGDDQDNMLDALGLPSRSSAARVPEQWLRLFPDGGDLDWKSFRIGGFGDRVPHAGSLGLPADARVGDVLTTGVRVPAADRQGRRRAERLRAGRLPQQPEPGGPARRGAPPGQRAGRDPGRRAAAHRARRPGVLRRALADRDVAGLRRRPVRRARHGSRGRPRRPDRHRRHRRRVAGRAARG